jgi:hypothetical protein
LGIYHRRGLLKEAMKVPFYRVQKYFLKKT